MATIRENYYKNRGLAINPLTEGLIEGDGYDGGIAADFIKKDEIVSSGDEIASPDVANPGQLFNTFVRSLRRKSNSNSPYGLTAGKLHEVMWGLRNEEDRKSQINVLRNVLNLRGIRISAKDANRLIDSYIEMYPDVDVSATGKKAREIADAEEDEKHKRKWEKIHPGQQYPNF